MSPAGARRRTGRVIGGLTALVFVATSGVAEGQMRPPMPKGAGPAHRVQVGNALVGKELFKQKGCVNCHAIEGVGGKIALDLGRTTHPHPPFELVGVMWNHSPTMTAMMGGLGIQRPLFEGNEMADLLAYLSQVQARKGAAARQGGGEHGH